ncbi:sulfur-oxidizing protein SoxY [Sagittula marina]|uniref:Sulfur-oxidizing protein SoxY n=1 Tax=Sagittula marina TaxID=943940 RepID=A0A7W6DR88_9RHOB|nr:quinoprotein dehydrogenase-associated SoxYZ-like carrier [Sagittula marina]MBB3987487.1 sulfur-oxidizing protein SoxY [Sagittula marina]
MAYAFRTAAILALLAMPVWAEGIQNPLTDGPTWDDLRFDLVGETVPIDGGPLLVEAPYRAHDAATVPVILRQTDPTAVITHATVVIDENPAPVAAELSFGPAMSPIDFELRVRVNQYSNVRVLTQTPEATYMTGRFVKASGGCSAPASRDPDQALAGLGQMKLRMFGDATQQSTARREAQIMLRHPNYSGLQRNQITQLFIPAHFIDHLEVWQGDDLLFTMDGGISISENPVFRFSYMDNGVPALTVKATDTEGNAFEQVLAKTAEG